MCDHWEIPHASVNVVISINTWCSTNGAQWREREKEGRELFWRKNWRGEVGVLHDHGLLLNSQE